MGKDFNVRLFEEEDVESLREYYTSSTGAPFDEGYWKWKYVENYANRGDSPGFVCTDKGGEFIGCILSTPNIKRYEKHTFYCTTGSDAFVRPEYRGMGVYNRMAEYLLEKVELHGSMRFSFYNDRTINAKTSAPILMETSISIKINSPEEVSRIFFRSQLKADAASFLYRLMPERRVKAKKIRVLEGSPSGYAEYYEGWAEDNNFIHTPRTVEHLNWRFTQFPQGEPVFYSVQDGEKLSGYIVALQEKNFDSHPVNTLVISDYLIDDNDPGVFISAVSEIIKHDASDLVITRPFSSPEYQRKLREIGFLDSMYFPLNRLIKPGGIGLRIFDERCMEFMEKPWYLTQSDCF